MSVLRHTWKKVLYEKLNVPDNYVDESFLKDLQTNVNLRTYTVLEAIIGTGVVIQEISSVVSFVVVFFYFDNQWLLPQTLLVNSAILLFGLYFLYRVTYRNNAITGDWRAMDDVKSTIFFVCFTFGLSPVMKTLTHTISTDTIYAMVALMMFAHLVFHDYGIVAPIVSRSISLNAAIFASVCLASRLPSTEGAFVLLTFAVEVFALFPVFRLYFQGIRKISIFMTIVMFITALSGLLTITTVGAILFMLITVIVNIICPVWFVKWQTCKNNIYGPWDEAVVHASCKEI